MARLRNWALIGTAEKLHLTGRVFGHPKRENGEEIRTSPIVIVIGNEVFTQSGTAYALEGPPDPDFLTYYLAREGQDPTNPLTALMDRAIEQSKVI